MAEKKYSARDLLDMMNPYSRFPVHKRGIVQGAIEASRNDTTRTNHQKAVLIAGALGVQAGSVEGILDYDFLP